MRRLLAYILFVLCRLEDELILLLLQLWPLSCHHDPQQLVLQTLHCDHEVQQSHLHTPQHIT